MTSGMSRWLNLAGFFILVYSSFLAAYYLNMPFDEVAEGPGVYAPILTSLLAVGTLVLAWQKSAREFKKQWALMAVGIGLWTCANVLWGILDLWGLVEEFYYSFSDILWIIGYIPLAAALWLCLAQSALKLSSARKVGWLIAILLLPVVAFCMLLVNIVTSPEFRENGWQALVPLLYPALDLVLVMGGGLLVIAARNQPWRWPWTMIGLALVLLAYGDTWYALAALYGWYDTIAWVRLSVDLPDTVSNLLIALGASISFRPEEFFTSPIQQARQGKQA